VFKPAPMPAKSTLGITPEEGVVVQPCEKLQALDPAVS